jgi:3-phenylpropionate/cinnamic acid dioxygenase small subunit
MSTLDNAALERAVMRSEIESLVIEYAYCLDRGDFEGLVALFTADCKVHVPRPPFTKKQWETFSGRGALAAYYAGPVWQNPHRKMRHVISNLRLEPRAGDSVNGTVALIGYREEAAGPAVALPLMVGDYEDTYRLVPGEGWRIARRKVSIVFLAEQLIDADYPRQWQLGDR